jgi:hypothetical protein
LRVVGTRELESRTIHGHLPDEAAVANALNETFSEHPMVNMSGRASAGFERGSAEGRPTLVVIAEVIVLPDLEPIPPGGEFPRADEPPLGVPQVVHARKRKSPRPY